MNDFLDLVIIYLSLGMALWLVLGLKPVSEGFRDDVAEHGRGPAVAITIGAALAWIVMWPVVVVLVSVSVARDLQKLR